MSDVELYAFEDENGVPDSYTTFNANDAREFARRYGLRWLAHCYEFVETELVEDYTR